MITRRAFLNSACAAALYSGLPRRAAAGPVPRKRMAIITTEWRYLSHAWHMGERFLVGYPIQGKWHRPAFDVVSVYVDQHPAGDLSRKRAAEFGFATYPSIAQALRCGAARPAVD